MSYSRDAGAWPRAAHPQDGAWDQGTATAGHPRCSHIILAWDVLPQGTLLYFPLPFVVSSVVSNSDDCRVCVASIVFFLLGQCLVPCGGPRPRGSLQLPSLPPGSEGVRVAPGGWVGRWKKAASSEPAAISWRLPKGISLGVAILQREASLFVAQHE